MTCTNEGFLSASFTVTNAIAAPFNIVVKGRDRSARENLIHAGKAGRTTIDNLAPRWSAHRYNTFWSANRISTTEAKVPNMLHIPRRHEKRKPARFGAMDGRK